MKAALCLVALCFAGYVSSAQYAWLPGKQYNYDVQARLFSGVGIENQYAGLQVKYQIKLTVTGQNTLHLKPNNFRAVELNAQLNGGWRDAELQNESPAEIKKELQEYLESPIILNMKNGVVDSIQVEGHLPTWAVNMKKAQASYFVADTTGANVVVSGNLNRKTNSVRPEEANDESGFFYETMEETVHGECETYYTVSQNGPFDWPFQFQKQAQPGYQNDQSQENGNNSNQNDQEGDNNSSQSQEQQDQQQDSQEQRKLYSKHRNYAIYRHLAQGQDSGSAEDSHETRQGELPWPKEFVTFCNENDQIYEITKSVNFTTCKSKAALGYSSNAGLHGRAGDNTIGSSLTRALLTRFLACGKDRKQYTILKIEQEEQVNFGLRVDQKTLSGTIQNLTLTSVNNAQQVEQLRRPKNINQLTYTFDPKEQQLQRQGKLQHAYFDVMGENDDDEDNKNNTEENKLSENSSSSEESGETTTYSSISSRRQHRKPRSVNSEESRENSGESKEKQYVTDAEGREFLRQPSLEYPPLLPLLVSPLQSSGMKKRVVALMEEITTDILTNEQPMAEAETLSKIATVAKIVRHLNTKEIRELYEQIAAKRQTEEDQTARNVFLDAVAMAGTNPAIVVLSRLIKSGDIHGEQANQLVMTFPLYVRTPTKALMKELFTLVQSPSAEKSLQLKTTALLAFANLIYQANVNLRIRNSRYPVAQYGEFGNEKDAEREFAQYFQKNLQEALEKEQSEGNNKHWTATYIKAYGATGLLSYLEEAQKILDDSADAYLKTKAILALNRLIRSRSSQNIPIEEIHGVDRNGQDSLTNAAIEKQVMPILISVAFDQGEHPEVRCAAITLILYTTTADVTIWQQLAYSTWFSSSQEVHSYIYSSLKSLATLNKHVPGIHSQMQRKARAVLALAKPITAGYAKSRNSFAAGIAEHLQSSYVHQLSYFGSKDSNIPNFMQYQNLVQYGSRAAGVNALKLTIHGHTIQKLASFAIQQYQNQNQNKNYQEGHDDLQQIYKVLGIERREQNEDIEGSLNVRFHNSVQRFWSLNEDVIERLIKQGKEQGLQKLMNGLPINYQKAIQVLQHVFEMPNGLGVPVTYNFRTTMLLSTRGNIKLVEEKNFGDVQIQAELHPILALKTHGRVSFKVPFTGKKYQAGVQRHFVLEAPFRALIRKAQSGQVVVAFTPTQLEKGAAPSGPIPLFTFHQKPYTAIITDSLWPTSHKEGGQMNVVHTRNNGEQQFKREMTFGQKALGFAFKSVEMSEYRQQNERSSGWVNFWQSFHSPSCFFQLGWLGGEKVRYAERRLSLDIANSETKTLVFTVAAKRQQNSASKDIWQDSSSASSQSSEENQSANNNQARNLRRESEEQNDSNQESSEEQQNQYRRGRKHGSSSDSGASHSAEDLSQNGLIVAAAIIGKRTPIRPVEQGKGSIQKILQKGSPSTVQYFAQYSKSAGRAYIRLAIGDAANEAAKALPQNSKSLQALAEAIFDSPNTKTQPDGCVEFEGEYNAPKWANRGQLWVSRKRLLSEELKVNIKAELQFGRSCSNMPHEIKAEGKLYRGEKMTEYAQTKSREAQQCNEDEKKGFNVSPVCMWVQKHQAAALNKGEIKISFTQMPKQFVNASDALQDFAKALLYPYVSHDRFHEGAGEKKVRVEFSITPNKEFLDVHITKPHSKLSFQSIRTNRAIRAVMPFTATQSLANNMRDRAFRADSDPFCNIENGYVNTFDNVTYRFNQKAFSNCYHVLAQDCSGRHPVSVLVKDIGTNQKKVHVYLNAKTKIELIPQPRSQRSGALQNAKLQVKINNQHVETLPRVVRSKQSGQVLAHIEQMAEGGIQVFTKYFDVVANGKHIIVYGSNPLRNRTCGICGDFNGEKVAEMKSPLNCPMSSGSALVASYAFKPQLVNENESGECKVDSQLRQQVKQENGLCLNDAAYLPNNPRLFPKAHLQSNFRQLQQGTCIPNLSDRVKHVLTKFHTVYLRPYVWNKILREEQAKAVAETVAAEDKIRQFLSNSDNVVNIARNIAQDSCKSLRNAKTGKTNSGQQIQSVCEKVLISKLLEDALILAMNPVCQDDRSCCKEQTNLPNDDFQKFLDYQVTDEALGSGESPKVPYVNDDESQKSCEALVALVMPRALTHTGLFIIQGNAQKSESQRERLADDIQEEVRRAVVKAVADRTSPVIASTDAAIRILNPGTGQDYTRDITQTTEVIYKTMCNDLSCFCPFV